MRLAALSLAVLATSVSLAQMSLVDADRNSTGKRITPIGSHSEIGSYPINMKIAHGGKFAIVSNIGFRQFLSSVRISDGKVISQIPFVRPKEGLYYGLAICYVDGKTLIYASQGAQDIISEYELSPEGQLSATGKKITDKRAKGSNFPLHFAGIALSSDCTKLYAVQNQTTPFTRMQGGLGIYDVATGSLIRRISTPGFPFAVAAITRGAAKDRKVYVSSERDGVVASYNPETGRSYRLIATGSQPTTLYLSPDQSRLFVANSSSDTISIIDTSTDRVLKTALLRPPALRGLPGGSPLGMTLTPDGSRLLVALSDMNCIAKVHPKTGAVEGYVPTGWLPTSLVCDPDGSGVLVASAKGVKTRNPNAKPVGTWGQYIQDVISGTVSRIPMKEFSRVDRHTATVARNNFIVPNLNSTTHPEFKNPGIKYVIYIVKENRTYDQVLSDIPRGVRDPSLCLFPQAVTPNQHALSQRFVQFDNFYVCAEVSADGWNWSTSGMVNPYTSRNTVYNYSGRGRSYDFEGANSGVPIDLLGYKDVARAPGGYLWENAIRHGVSFRNYGMFMTFDDPGDKRNTPGVIDQKPSRKELVGRSCLDFRRYDLSYADSEAYSKHNHNFRIQMREFGPHKAPSRFTVWKREFDEFCRKGELPRLQLVRFGTDHTAGTRDGSASPRAMVADNDYAVGQLVEAVSKSRFWKETAIFVLEDDAQAGYDSIDAHRSTCYVLSPFVKRNLLESRFFNTDSVLRTMELILGMKPMNQFDAVARPMTIFDQAPYNDEAYEAILPSKEVITEVNTARTFRSAKSEALFPRFIADPGFDKEQTEIVWRAIKGAPAPVRFR